MLFACGSKLDELTDEREPDRVRLRAEPVEAVVNEHDDDAERERELDVDVDELFDDELDERDEDERDDDVLDERRNRCMRLRRAGAGDGELCCRVTVRSIDVRRRVVVAAADSVAFGGLASAVNDSLLRRFCMFVVHSTAAVFIGLPDAPDGRFCGVTTAHISAASSGRVCDVDSTVPRCALVCRSMRVGLRDKAASSAANVTRCGCSYDAANSAGALSLRFRSAIIFHSCVSVGKMGTASRNQFGVVGEAIVISMASCAG